MRARDLLKWKRALNEIKFKHSELELIKEICRTHGVEFHMFMEEYCEQNGINLNKLNQEKSVREAKAKEQFQAIQEEQQRAPEGKMVISENHFTENAPPVEELFVEQKDHDDMRRAFKDLFKKLALNLHPDRAAGLTAEEREVRLSMFKDAKQALDNGDYFLLLEMSEKFNIRMPKNYKQQTRWMKARIKQLNQQIQAEKHTYNYVFSECETIDEKEKIVKNFLRQIFQI
tara:strand:+ start:1693 stop:2382 length:690 start_codon:yes stop_codon:yes gene_type:complete